MSEDQDPWGPVIPAYERWAEPFSRRMAQAALDQAAPRAGGAVLDVAAGTGALAVTAAERGYRVRGIDASPAMTYRLQERLRSYRGCSGAVMDAFDLRYGDDEFDAAYSVLGVLNFGPGTPKALAEMVRVVRPGGIISVAGWADARSAPFFEPLGRAVARMNDPRIGVFVPALSSYLDRAEVEAALVGAGCVDAVSEVVEVECAVPDPEAFIRELQPILAFHPQYAEALAADRGRFEALLTEEAGKLRTGGGGHLVGRANIVHARVPGVPGD
ncbi:class I SAM-dependent methyltransferase [Catenuloplanes sp. NPDC051500]|uniref:class I SAM-dependent methyltransferase n=1 Tax=Catenuloplanes sp. NPDC051500 TaxID=3363959 RepID=UPI0037B4941E